MRPASQPVSVNGAFFSSLSQGENMLITDNIALIAHNGEITFCFELLPPNSARFVCPGRCL